MAVAVLGLGRNFLRVREKTQGILTSQAEREIRRDRKKKSGKGGSKN